jgi:hypothetical protein
VRFDPPKCSIGRNFGGTFGALGIDLQMTSPTFGWGKLSTEER